MLLEDLLVEQLCPVEVVGGLMETGKVVGGGDRDGAVVGLVMLGLRS